MNLQLFFTLVVVGGLVGLISILTGKGSKATAPVHLVVAIAGAFLGWFIFTEVNRFALEILFALGGSVALLWLVRLLKK